MVTGRFSYFTAEDLVLGLVSRAIGVQIYLDLSPENSAVVSF